MHETRKREGKRFITRNVSKAFPRHKKPRETTIERLCEFHQASSTGLRPNSATASCPRREAIREMPRVRLPRAAASVGLRRPTMRCPVETLRVRPPPRAAPVASCRESRAHPPRAGEVRQPRAPPATRPSTVVHLTPELVGSTPVSMLVLMWGRGGSGEEREG